MGKIQIEKLNPHPKNTLYFTDIEGEKYEEIKRSIITNGIRDPIKVTTAYTIISGHQRYRIAQDLEFSEVPVEIVDVNEWDAEYLLIAENVERRGEAESDSMKKGRIAKFLKEYWEIKDKNNNISDRPKGDQKTMKDVQSFIGESERTTQRLTKLNDLIEPLQNLVSNKRLSVRAAEQLANLTQQEQTDLYDKMGEAIGEVTVEESKKLRTDIENLRTENKRLSDENVTLTEKVKTLETKKPISEESRLKQKIKETEEERDRYIGQVNELEKKNISVKDDEGQELSPESKLLIKKRPSIQECSYELIDLIKFLSVSPPYDLPDLYLADFNVLFDSVIKEVIAAKHSLTKLNLKNYVDAEYSVIEKGEING